MASAALSTRLSSPETSTCLPWKRWETPVQTDLIIFSTKPALPLMIPTSGTNSTLYPPADTRQPRSHPSFLFLSHLAHSQASHLPHLQNPPPFLHRHPGDAAAHITWAPWRRSLLTGLFASRSAPLPALPQATPRVISKRKTPQRDLISTLFKSTVALGIEAELSGVH